MMSQEREPQRRSARRLARRELCHAFPARMSLLAVLCGLGGILPSVFAALVGLLIASVPAAVGPGFASSAGHRVVLTLAGIAVVMVLQEVLAATESVVSTDLYRRFDGYLFGKLIELATRWPDLDLFDDPVKAAQVDRARRIAEYGPGELVSGLQTQWSVRVAGVASAVLLATVLPWYLLLTVAVPLTAGWVAVGFALQASYYRADPFWSNPLRRAGYLQRVGLMPEWAKEVRVFGLISWLTERYSDEWRRVMATLQQARRGDRRLLLLWSIALLAANAAAMLLVARSTWAGAMSVAQLVVAVQALLGLASLAAQDGDVWIENGAAPMPELAAFEQIVDARMPPPEGPPSTAGPAAAGSGHAQPVAAGLALESISFEHVHFTYPGRSTAVYDGLELTLAAGTSTAIVGLNGAGKTTLVKLLTGLCRPAQGRVRIDGIDLADLDIAAWRRSVAVIFQDFVHYELSMRDNVAFGAIETGTGKAAASASADLAAGADLDARVNAALHQAGADDVAAGLPAGLDTVLSRRFPGGVDLSGGQWQRVALARAFFRDAPLVILDEPSSALDPRAEYDLFASLRGVLAGRTALFISHRFSTVRTADRIYVMADGRVTEHGTHDELMAARGSYAELFALQASAYLDP